jgi:hypothetical protein
LEAIRFLQGVYDLVVRDYNYDLPPYDCMVAYREFKRTRLIKPLASLTSLILLKIWYFPCFEMPSSCVYYFLAGYVSHASCSCLLQEKRFFCTVTGDRLGSDDHWWFPSCGACRKSAKHNGYHYVCSNDACSSVDAELTYCISVFATDGMAEAEFMLFDKVTAAAVGKTIHYPAPEIPSLHQDG